MAGKLRWAAATLRTWIRQAEIDSGERAGQTTADRERLKQLGRENFELPRANDIPGNAAAFFAQAESGRQRR